MNLLPLQIDSLGVVSPILVSPCENDQRDLGTILSDWHAPIQAAGAFGDPPMPYERDFPDADWKALFRMTEPLPRPPQFIVWPRLADEDVLRTPFVGREVRHSVQCAWDCRQRRWPPAIIPGGEKRASNTFERLARRTHAG
jgi:hypothetical protein